MAPTWAGPGLLFKFRVFSLAYLRSLATLVPKNVAVKIILL